LGTSPTSFPRMGYQNFRVNTSECQFVLLILHNFLHFNWILSLINDTGLRNYKVITKFTASHPTLSVISNLLLCIVYCLSVVGQVFYILWKHPAALPIHPAANSTAMCDGITPEFSVRKRDKERSTSTKIVDARSEIRSRVMRKAKHKINYFLQGLSIPGNASPVILTVGEHTN
jgi:hypothetical protein